MSEDDLRASHDNLLAALKRIAWLRPAGDINTAKNTRALVKQIERIALAAIEVARLD